MFFAEFHKQAPVRTYVKPTLTCCLHVRFSTATLRKVSTYAVNVPHYKNKFQVTGELLLCT